MSGRNDNSAEPFSREWQKEKITGFAEMRENYVLYARFLESALKKACSTVSPLALIQSRAKNVSSYAEKLVRKLDKFSRPGYDFTDLCGARVIVHTRDEVNQVCSWIEDNFDIDRENSQNAADKLTSNTFGYLSVHYVLSLRRTEYFGEIPPERCMGLKAEIQVRTLLQHTWADIMHDRFYKNRHDLPAHLHRECSRIAAVLENTDMDIVDLIGKLDVYQEHYAVFLPRNKLEHERSTLNTILQLEPDDQKKPAIALRLIQLMEADEAWEDILSVITALPETDQSPNIRDRLYIAHGKADCFQGLPTHHEIEIQAGETFLKKVCDQADGEDPLYPEKPANIAMAASILGHIARRKGEEEQAHQYALKAFSLQPDNPYFLAECLFHELKTSVNMALMTPLFKKACECCNSHIAVGIELPRAYFAKARFLRLLGCERESAAACCYGIEHLRTNNPSKARAVLAREIEFFRKWGSVGSDLTLSILSAAWQAFDGLQPEGAKPAFFGCHSIPRVVWLAGKSNTIRGLQSEPDTVQFSTILEQYPGMLVENRSVTNWEGLLADRLKPNQVMLFYAVSDQLDELEQMAALALGATVVCIEAEADKMAVRKAQHPFRQHPGLLVLPQDGAALQAYLEENAMALREDESESLGRAVHEAYIKSSPPAISSERRPWSVLDDEFRQSSISQARFAAVTLKACGYSIRRVEGKPERVQFSAEETEKMARLEHGRYLAERIRQGWTWNSRKCNERKENPNLVRWEELSEGSREYNRNAIRAIPEIFASAGYEVYRDKTN